MARYGISYQGMCAFRQLAKTMENICDEIDQHSYQLMSSVSSLEGLGIYREAIGECLTIIHQLTEQAKEPTSILSFNLYEVANRIEEILPPDAFPDDDDSSYPAPPVKRLVRKR